MEELSQREAEVLELVSQHLSNPQIAERLFISVRTVESHVASLIRKLGVTDRRALVAYAAEGNRPATGVPSPAPSSHSAEATHTFLFTDVVGSTRLWQSDPTNAPDQLQADATVIATVVEAHGGRVFKTTGDGTCSVFASVPQALWAAAESQQALTLPARMAVHTGEALERDGDFFGTALSRCARLMDAAHGGQVLVSAVAARVAGESPGQGIALKDLGQHGLRDLEGPEPVFELLAEGLQSDFPPLRTLRARHNLPLPRSSFIGRRAEREGLRQMILSEALVTLTGIGGCGKTRLGLQVASDLLGDFGDGVFFIDLSAVSDANLVGQAVAGALKLQIRDPTPDALADYFAERQTLLLFDNCEHLLDSCAEVADVLLGERCPGLRILATSREPLGLEGERVFRVPSLDIAGEAVALFVERARSVQPDLRIDARSEATVAEICRRLDGIPLAIELAATRAAHLSLEEILERLNDRFRLLVGGRRRIQRQQTLTAALDWSYDLLSPDEQLLLRRLAVFRGSFSLSAAEAICHPQAMELVGSLVAKSLVDFDAEGEEVRYRLLESVRIYAEGKLVETGESEQLRSAHRDFYLRWIESLPLEQVRRGRGALGASRLAIEADNLTAALEWCRQQGRYDLCARIAVRMANYWYYFVRFSEMMAWWRDLDAGLPAEDRDHRAMALLLRSQASMAAKEWEELNVYSAQACALADPQSWLGVEAQYLQATYWSVIECNRHPLIRPFADAITDAPGSVGIFERAFELDASMGLSPGPLDRELFYLSRVVRANGRDEALALLGDWLADLGDSSPRLDMAPVFALYGDIRTALEVKSRAERPGVPFVRFLDELSEAVLAATQGKFDEAEQHLATMASVMRDFAIPRGEATCIIGFAKVALDRGDYARASRLLAAVNSSVGPEGRFVTHVDAFVYIHCTGVLRDVLDPETAHTTEAEGAALSLKETLDAELMRAGTTALANPAD
jgi:predicted ATPase/class 3 adenylate cyclase